MLVDHPIQHGVREVNAMNLYFRLIFVLLASLGKPAQHPRVRTSRVFRVWPWDIDAFLHMNNGRYSQIMDVARIDWMRRARIFDAVIKNRWGGVLGGSLVRFRRVLKPFQKYRVWTEVVSWDEKWFFLEHRFETLEGKLVAVGLTRAGLREKTGWVHTERVVGAIVPGLKSPPHPERVLDWLHADRLLETVHEKAERGSSISGGGNPSGDGPLVGDVNLMAAE